MGFKVNIRTHDEDKTTVVTTGDVVHVSVYHETYELRVEDGMAKNQSDKLVTVFANDFEDELSVSVNDLTERPGVMKLGVFWEVDTHNDCSDCEAKGNECEKEDHYWVRANAIVSYPLGDGLRRATHFFSSGLNGICPGCFEDLKERRRMRNEELNNLREHLDMFKVDMSTYDACLKTVKSYRCGEEI